MTTYDSLNTIFNPQSIALIGASNHQGDPGHSLLKNMVGSSYQGAVYPINPEHKSMLGMKVYPRLKNIPDPIDLAIIATPAETVISHIEECARCGIKNALVVSSGFQESGPQGLKHFRQLVKAAKTANVRIIGPNSLGFIRPQTGLNASFAKKNALPGPLAFISQSGSLCTSVLDWSIQEKVGFSHFISIGSTADINYHDLIDYLGQDPHTQSILIYMESLTETRRFISAARSIGKTKPIIILRSGRSEEGSAAIKSNTGTPPGDDTMYDAIFKRSGIARVDTIKELFNVAQTLSTQASPKGNRLLIITNAGGPGIIATDAHIRQGGEMAVLSKTTENELKLILTDRYKRGNPIDLHGNANAQTYGDVLKRSLQDKSVDGVLVLLTPQSCPDISNIGRTIGIAAQQSCKTVLAVFMGADEVKDGSAILTQLGVPVYSSPEEAVSCFDTIAQYNKNQELLTQTPASIPEKFKQKTGPGRAIIEKALDSGRTTLTELESKHFIAHYGLPTAPSKKVTSPAQAARSASELGFPVAMKILSPDILYKSEVNGVQLNIRSKRAAIQTYQQLIADTQKNAPTAEIEGVTVEKMVSKKHELFIGSRFDPNFGPIITFGMGGEGVEFFQDQSVGIPPLNMALVKNMIEETKIHKVLQSYKGTEAVDLKSLQFLLYQFSYMIMDFPELETVEINPLVIDKDGSTVLDAKITLNKKRHPKKSRPYSHLIVSPYPKDWEKRTKTSCRTRVLLRPIRPEDETMEADMFKAMSEETQRLRFFQLIKDITHEMLIRYTQIDYDREIAIVAELTEKGQKKMAGVARLIGDPYNDSAEFAVVVADPWQGKGIGAVLTDYVLKLARQRKLDTIYAHFLSHNRLMRSILEKRGFTVTRNDDTYRAELKLT